MNELATIVSEYIESKGIKQQHIADCIGLSKQGLYQLLRRKFFGVTEANRVLNAIDCKLEVNIIPIEKD